MESSQADATIPLMAEKVQRELRSDAEIVLCDGQGNKLVESSGTTGMLCDDLTLTECLLALIDLIEFLFRFQKLSHK